MKIIICVWGKQSVRDLTNPELLYMSVQQKPVYVTRDDGRTQYSKEYEKRLRFPNAI